MILAAERVRQRRYDWILRSRPDVARPTGALTTTMLCCAELF